MTESMNPTFDSVGDVMPSAPFYGYRNKLVHAVGVIGKVKFVSNS
jgi:hypothetical protein